METHRTNAVCASCHARTDVLGGTRSPHRKGRRAVRPSIYKISDTAEVPALVRNALTGQVDGNAVVVLSAPATYLARALELPARAS